MTEDIMKLAITGLCLLLVSPLLWAQSAPATSVGEPSEDDRLAAVSLRLSAQSLIHARPDVLGRAGRLLALVQLADSLVPDTGVMLADIYESQGRLKEAADVVSEYLSRRPNDFVQQARRIRLAAGAMQTARQREKLYKSMATRKDAPPAVRAEAAVALGRILQGKGEDDLARKAYLLALEHDPYHPAALTAPIVLGKDATDANRVRALMKALRGNPADLGVAHEASALLSRLGVHDQSLRMVNHMAFLAAPHVEDRGIKYNLTLTGLITALDAGQAAEAIGTFLPELTTYPDSLDIYSMLVEAYKITGQKDRATELANNMESALKRLAALAGPDEMAAAMAWFYLDIIPDSKKALEFARRAEKADGNDPFTQRVLGVAELKTGSFVKGRARLKKLVSTDAYAVLYLAERYIEANRREDAEKAILAAATLPRGGAAFRRLTALAKKHGIAIPDAVGAEEAREAAKGLHDDYLDMVRSPEKHLVVTIQAERNQVAFAETIRINATLTNAGQVDIPLGLERWFDPVIALGAIAIVDGKATTFMDLPLIRFPAPRYLKKGQTVKAGVAINVGGLGMFLARSPMADVELTVNGMLAPVQRGRQLKSAVPGVRPLPTKIARARLIPALTGEDAQDWPKRYQRVLGRIVFDIRRGKLPTRLRAARQVGALLGVVQAAQRGMGPIVAAPRIKLNRPVLLRMVVEIMKDKSAAVRAEMLAALNGVPLDSFIMNLLAPAIADDRPLVRCRLVELLGTSRMSGQKALIEHLGRTGGPMVERMAAAFRAPKKPEPAESGKGL